MEWLFNKHFDFLHNQLCGSLVGLPARRVTNRVLPGAHGYRSGDYRASPAEQQANAAYREQASVSVTADLWVVPKCMTTTFTRGQQAKTGPTCN